MNKSGKFSVDDILEQYSSKSKSELAGSSKDIDLESILGRKPLKEQLSFGGVTADDIERRRDAQADVIEEKEIPSEVQENAEQEAESIVAEPIIKEVPAFETEQEENPSEPVQEKDSYVPANDDSDDDSEKMVFGKDKQEKKKSRINTAVIEKLVQEKKENETDMTVTGAIPPVNRASVKDINMDLEGKLIPKTEQFEISENLTEEEKIEMLEKRREKKVQDFVLNNVDDENGEQSKAADEQNQTDAKEQEKLPIDEFTSFEQSQDVLSDIMQLKSNIVTRLCVLMFTSVFAVYISLANDFNLPIISALSRNYSPEAFVFTLTILGIVSCFVSYTVIFGGLKKLFRLKADCDSIAAIGIVTTVITGIINLFASDSIQSGNYHVYTAVAILGLLFNTLGKLSMVNRADRNFRFAAGEFEKHAFVKVEDEDIAYKFTKGTLDDFPELVTTRKTEFVDDFLKNSYSSDISDEYSRKAAPLTLAAGVLAAIICFAVNSANAGMTERLITSLSALCGLVTICSSLAIMLIVNLPLARASKKYLQSSAVLLGYSAVEEYSDTNSVLIDAEQLFPDGMVDLVNLKAMSSTLIEDCILYAASLTCQAGGIMKSTFYKMLRGKTEMLYPVESYIYEDGLGLSGWIEHKRILFGSRELMENHSIEGLPTAAKESEYAKGNIPVYLSISGVVSAIFFVRAGANLTVSKWLQELTDRNITVVIRSVDAFISTKFLSEMFEVEPSKLKLLPFRFHKEYEKEKAYAPRVSSSMICSGHFPSIAMLICGTKNIQTLSVMGMMLQFTSVVLGALIAIIMVAIGSFAQMTASIVLCYNLIWLLATMLIQQFKKV